MSTKLRWISDVDAEGELLVVRTCAGPGRLRFYWHDDPVRALMRLFELSEREGSRKVVTDGEHERLTAWDMLNLFRQHEHVYDGIGRLD